MAYLIGLRPSEMRRIAFCQGCKHLSNCGDNGCCNYIFNMDRRRPCPFGEGCTEYDGGRKRHRWEIGPKTTNDPSWGNQRSGRNPKGFDKLKAKAMYERGDQIQDIISACDISKSTFDKYRRIEGWTRQAEIKRPPRENTPKWDTARARQMFEAGVTKAEIARQMGVHFMTVSRRAAREGWTVGGENDER